MAVEEALAALNAAEAGQGSDSQSGSEGQGGSAQGNQNQAGQQAQSGNGSQGSEPTLQQLAQMIQEMRGGQNRFVSEFSNFRKSQSEWDKQRSQMEKLLQQQTNTAPKSWAELPPEQQKATDDLLTHRLRELFGLTPEFKDKWSKYDAVESGYTSDRNNNRIVGLASQILGADFDKFNPAMGDIYLQIKQAAERGDPGAQRFQQEILQTESGVYRLVDMAKAAVAQSMQNQSAQAKAEQDAKAGRVSASVGSRNAPARSVDANNLPTDKDAKRKAVAELLDAEYARK